MIKAHTITSVRGRGWREWPLQGVSEEGEGVQSSGGAEAVERMEEVVGVRVGDGCGMEEVLVRQAGLAAGWGKVRGGDCQQWSIHFLLFSSHPNPHYITHYSHHIANYILFE